MFEFKIPINNYVYKLIKRRQRVLGTIKREFKRE